ncbi:hypothetical protein L1889_13090 [Paenalcaligenes niemegkensis]|uniref:hypothetical protein n=1 Tax=Paenalcaligenes niemegkensis TaxID=2895469 RepID=UPI001EE98656|nr:hypothetical protein [Paenalcaligenes niemegkensis]MCQ9617503.1 hypothetical protein [Paenalcaligenes niemegkensis]
MTSAWINAVSTKRTEALEKGELQPINTEQVVIMQDGIPFIVRWLPSDQGDHQALFSGAPTVDTTNPFLPPAAALTVGQIGDYHTVVLNKYPVCENHVVLARKEPAQQLEPLEYQDFLALAVIISEEGGWAFTMGDLRRGQARHTSIFSGYLMQMATPH